MSHAATAPADVPWKLNLPNADVNDVLSLYEVLTHFKIIRDYFVQGKISIMVAEEVTQDKAIEMIERTLFADGFAIIQIAPDTVQIVGPGKNARTYGIPVIDDPKRLPTHERVISYVFRFEYKSALEMQTLFAHYCSPPSSFTSFLADSKGGNTLLATERTSVIRHLVEIVAKMDIPDSKTKP